MLLRHLALAVQDEQRSREFYERWFEFGVEPAERMDDGVLMLYGPGDVTLALGPADERPTLPPFLHFGFNVDAAGPVREPARRVRGRGRRDRRVLGRARLRERQGPRPRRLRRRVQLGALGREALAHAVQRRGDPRQRRPGRRSPAPRACCSSVSP